MQKLYNMSRNQSYILNDLRLVLLYYQISLQKDTKFVRFIQHFIKVFCICTLLSISSSMKKVSSSIKQVSPSIKNVSSSIKQVSSSIVSSSIIIPSSPDLPLSIIFPLIFLSIVRSSNLCGNSHQTLTILIGKNCVLLNSIQEWLLGCF